MCGTVAVGLSGGVDSLAAALVLREQGYKIVGVHLQLWGEGHREEVARLCDRLQIEMVCYDGQAVFREQVVDLFVKEYLAGRTPNPCTVCNNLVKWNLLAEAADSLGIEKLATGHYVQIVRETTGWYIKKGEDIHKDQSYFLWGLKQDILSRTVTPLGVYTKAQVKAYVESCGFSDVVRKRESMGICFLEGKDYRDFIRYHCGDPLLMQEGDIVDGAGNRIGRHTGLLNYTIGQRRDMPLCNGQPLYVAGIDAKRNRIIAGSKQELYRNHLVVTDVNLVCPEEICAEDITVKVRGLGLNPEGYALLNRQPDSSIQVSLSSPAWAVASGQPVAFYRNNLLIGGGIAL
ncbi:MAG: tRNA 2-thiouridine(34) synthase MnmA [Oscillibacter sp.]|nr:tRNA 2-thiouridine(34) synthase MnmA [Oscillibacter sp.]